MLDHPHLTSAEVADLLSDQVTARDVGRLRRCRNVIGVKFPQRGYLHPAFQIDAERSRVDPKVVAVSNLLLKRMTELDAVSWWLRKPPTGVAARFEDPAAAHRELMTEISRNAVEAPRPFRRGADERRTHREQ